MISSRDFRSVNVNKHSPLALVKSTVSISQWPYSERSLMKSGLSSIERPRGCLGAVTRACLGFLYFVDREVHDKPLKEFQKLSSYKVYVVK